MASLKDMDYTILHLQQTYVDAISPLFKFITLKSSIYAGLLSDEALPNFKGRHFYPILSWKDLIYAKLMQITSFLIYHSAFIRNIYNTLFKFAADRNERNVLARKKSFAKKSNMNMSLLFPMDFGKRIWDFIQTALTILHRT